MGGRSIMVILKYPINFDTVTKNQLEKFALEKIKKKTAVYQDRLS